jgi:hypothetical protein
MKRILLTSILTSICVLPAFAVNVVERDNSTDQSGNSPTANAQSDSYNPRDNNDSQSPLANNMRAFKSHRQMIDEQNNQNSQGTQRRIAVSKEDMRPPRGSNQTNEKMQKNWPSPANDTKDKNKHDDSDDENPNLANLASPEPKNIRDNLTISDQDRALNRQMMLNGPQGGIQNDQPRGIGRVTY